MLDRKQLLFFFLLQGFGEGLKPSLKSFNGTIIIFEFSDDEEFTNKLDIRIFKDSFFAFQTYFHLIGVLKVIFLLTKLLKLEKRSISGVFFNKSQDIWKCFFFFVELSAQLNKFSNVLIVF